MKLQDATNEVTITKAEDTKRAIMFMIIPKFVFIVGRTWKCE